MSRLSSAAMASVSASARTFGACAIRQAPPTRYGVSCRVRQQGLAASQGQNRPRLVATASLAGGNGSGRSASAPGKESGAPHDAPAAKQGAARAPVVMAVQAAGMLVILVGQAAGWPVAGTLAALAFVALMPRLLAGWVWLVGPFPDLAPLFESAFDRRCRGRKPAEVLRELRSEYVSKSVGLLLLAGFLIFVNLTCVEPWEAEWMTALSAFVLGARLSGFINARSLFKAGQRREQQEFSSSGSGSSSS